jgi:hypothetical protein
MDAPKVSTPYWSSETFTVSYGSGILGIEVKLIPPRNCDEADVGTNKIKNTPRISTRKK